MRQYQRHARLSFSRPNQSIKQRPRQHEAAQALHQAARPQLPAAAEVRLRATLSAAYTERIYEAAGQQREGDVEDEAWVRFEAQDTGAHTE